MDVVYPLINNSKFKDDFELRMSLRSLEVQPWVRNVYLVGHAPKWFKGWHIKCSDPYTMCKDANIINKILRACTTEDLSEKFIVNSDDQFFLNVVTEEMLEVPPFDNKTVRKNYTLNMRTSSWPHRVLATVDWCQKNGYPDWTFDAHRPYMVDKKLYPYLMGEVAWGYNNGFTTHVYFNLRGVQPKVDSGSCVRIKNALNLETIRKTIQRSRNANFLNINNSALNIDMKQFLQNRFPNTSRWEK